MPIANDIALWFAILNGTLVTASIVYWLRRHERVFVCTGLIGGALLLMALRDLLTETWSLPLLALAWLALIAAVPILALLLVRKYRPQT